MRRTLVLLAAVTASLALAAAKISPQGIIVNPVPGDLQVKVWVDRDPGKSGRATYRVGDPIYVYVHVTRDAYVYLFDIKPDGSIDMFLPNPYDRNNRLRAGETRRFPPPRARYRFTVEGPPGEELVLALASSRPLSSREVGDLARGQVRLRGLKALSKALSIVVDPLPGREWASDWAKFRVVGGQNPPPPPAPQGGTIEVESSPSQASVYLDGEYLGKTPLVASASPGRHQVEVKKAGYRAYRATVRLEDGQRVKIVARLAPEVREGRLSVKSSPEGAKVYIDGSYRGRTPITLSLKPGSYRLKLKLPGYAEYSERVTVRAGETTYVYAQLAPAKARLVVETDVRARVFVDGYELGWTQNGRLAAEVDPGRRWVVVLAPGYEPVVEEVDLRAGETRTLRLRLYPVR